MTADVDTATTATTSAAEEMIGRLPADFRWGVATSAYQIEGAVTEGGRTRSIWDTYAHTPGRVDGGDNGDVACDHYHRMPQDVALIADLGVDVYRFSVSWPRVQPGGRGPGNPAGLDFYDRLVDELLRRQVDPWLTLYHWDLPQELEDAGGWPERDTAERFADYAELVFTRLSDRVRTWTTLNEPWCSAFLGYATGAQAPGRADFPAAIRAVHHLLLGHGLATQRLRALVPSGIDFGITLNLGTAEPVSDDPLDVDAARRSDGLGARIFLDPLLRGRYPTDVMADLAAAGAELPIEDGDLPVIATPIDVLGVNFYSSSLFSGRSADGRTTDDRGLPVTRAVGRGKPLTAIGWEIVPECFHELLVRLHDDYPGVPVVITENGAAFEDRHFIDGRVDDQDRIDYLAGHLAAVACAREAGVDVRGYMAWSLLDNFEWSYGYDKRFGLIHVDYQTLVRTPKRSAQWYSQTIRRVRGR